jgi:hypothetical protein
VTEHDPLLRRVGRNGVLACAAMAVVAAIASRERVEAALGVLGGGALVAVSYYGIRSGADVLVAATVRKGRRGRVAAGVVKFIARYAILAALAYVVVARLRLPPIAVFSGASSFVLAIALEALRGTRRDG